MAEWRDHYALGGDAWESWYQEKFSAILSVLESDQSRRFSGEIERLRTILKPLSYEARLKEMVQKVFVGRDWIVDAIDNWSATRTEDSRLFWLSGSAGTGKSAFAAHLAHFGRDRVVAVHFCDWRQPGSRSPANVIHSIAFQLATRFPDYRKILLDVPQLANLDSLSVDELFNLLIANPLNIAIGETDTKHVIMIDALDEALANGSNELVEMLAANVQRLPDWLSIIATSRPEYDVSGPLQAYKPFLLSTEQGNNQRDLSTFLEVTLEHQLATMPDKSKTIEQILRASDGLFLYTDRFCEDVLQGNLSLNDPDSFPRGLGGIFHQYFARQFPDTEHYRTYVRPILRLVLAAPEPIPIEILQSLLNDEDESLFEMLRSLSSLIPIAGSTVRPYHKSLADWLSDEKRADIFYVSVQKGHEQLAQRGLLEFKNQGDNLHDYHVMYLPYHLRCAGIFDKLIGDLGRPGILLDLKFSWESISRGFTPSYLEAVNLAIQAVDSPENSNVSLRTNDPLETLAHFVAQNTHVLPECSYEEFVVLARNSRASGWLVDAAEKSGVLLSRPWLARNPRPEPFQNPRLRRRCIGGGVELASVFLSTSEVLTGGPNGFKVWDIERGSVVRESENLNVQRFSLCRGGRKVLSLGERGRILRLWDIVSLNSVVLFDEDVNGYGFAISGSGNRGISSHWVDYDSSVLKIWDTESGTLIGEIRDVYQHDTDHIQLTSDGSLAFVALRNKLHVWNLTQVELIAEIDCTCTGLLVSADDRWLLTLDQSGRFHGAKVLDLTDFSVLASISLRPEWRVDPRDLEGRLWQEGQEELTLKLDFYRDQLIPVSDCPLTYFSHRYRNYFLSFVDDCRGIEGMPSMSPDGKTLVTTSGSGINLWNKVSDESDMAQWHLKEVRAVGTNSNGTVVATGGAEGEIYVWDAKSKQRLSLLHHGGVKGVAFSGDGSNILSFSYEHDDMLRLWEVGDSSPIAAFRNSSGRHFKVTFSHGEPVIVSTHDDDGRGPFVLDKWDVHTGKAESEFVDSAIYGIFVSLTGPQAVAYLQKGHLILFENVLKGLNFRTLPHTINRPARPRAISSNFSFLLVDTGEKLEVRELLTGALLSEIGHEIGADDQVDFSPDGNLVVVAGSEWLQIYNAQNGEPLLRHFLDSRASSFAFIESTGELVCGTMDGSVHFLSPKNMTFGMWQSWPLVTQSVEVDFEDDIPF